MSRSLITPARTALSAVMLSLLATAAYAQTSAPAPTAADKQAVLAQQKENEDAETLCRGIKDKTDFEKCLELYFTDKDAFQKFLQAHSHAGQN